MPVKFRDNIVLVSGKGKNFRRIPVPEFPILLGKHLEGDPLTRFIENQVSSFVASGLPQAETFLIIRMICTWGGIRGKNPRRIYDQNSIDQFMRLRNSLAAARLDSLAGNYREAIYHLTWINGARISFASKFLKFLCPDHAAVLDSRIKKGLYYEGTPHGYDTFVRDCCTIRDHLNQQGQVRDGGLPWRTSDVEMALFKKVNP